MLDISEVSKKMPMVGDKLTKNINVGSHLPIKRTGEVVFINKTKLWYQMKFDFDGWVFTECYQYKPTVGYRDAFPVVYEPKLSDRPTIIDAVTGEKFFCIRHAASMLGLTVETVQYGLKTGKEYAGHKFEWIQRNRNAAAVKGRPVKDISTGIVYGSMKKAAKATGLTEPTILYSIKRGQPTKSGHQFIKFNEEN